MQAYSRQIVTSTGVPANAKRCFTLVSRSTDFVIKERNTNLEFY